MEDWFLGGLVAFLVAVVVGLIGWAIYDASQPVKDPIVLEASEWVCTDKDRHSIPITQNVGNVPVTTQVMTSSCTQYTKIQ